MPGITTIFVPPGPDIPARLPSMPPPPCVTS